MAVYGVLGDIHGNVEGLRAALDVLRQRGVDRFLSMGDIIGYNADSNECVALMRALDARIIAGNHDLIGTGQLGFEKCSNKARYSLGRTRRTLTPDSAAWIRSLPRTLLVDAELALIHGGVRDVQLYMTSSRHIRANLPLLREDMPSARLCFFGHSHEPGIYEVAGDDVVALPAESTVLARDRLYFINPGSVDAQRKRDYRMAEFAILDTAAWHIEFLQVPYDADRTEARAVRNGYRIGPLTDRWYTLRRRLRRLLGGADGPGGSQRDGRPSPS